jgi:Helix-turn-helix domain
LCAQLCLNVLIVSTIYSTGKGPIYPGFCYRCEATNQLLKAMILDHTIALDPTPEQAAHFRRACGTARFAYNWGLAEWRRMREAGEKPSTALSNAAGTRPQGRVALDVRGY